VIYDVTILSVRAGQTPAALERVEQAVLGADRGRLQACWYCEIGAVGDIMLIRGFRTAAELTAAEKNAVSHRGQALRALVEKLA